MIGTFAFSGLALQQSMASHAASRDSIDAKHQARQAKAQVQVLEQNLAKALMINEALWEIIRDKLNLKDEDLYNKLYEVDMRDGQLDGKNQQSVSECPKCQRKNSPRHAACIYCGEVIDQSVFGME